MFNKILLSLIIITSCVNAMEKQNGINNGLIENSSNNSKSVILTKSNNINGIMNNEKTIKNNTNNINICKNARNNNKNILNTNTLNIEYEKNKELSRYIINDFLDINTLPKGYMINVNNCIKLLQQNKIALEKEYDSLISKLLEQISKREGLNEEMRKIGYKVEEIQKEINSKKKDKSKEFKKKLKENSDIDISNYIKEQKLKDIKDEKKITEYKDIELIKDFAVVDFVLNEAKEELQKELGTNEQNKKNLNQEIKNIDKIIMDLKKENEKLENRISQTNSCIECLEQCKYDRILNITKEDLALKLKINYLIAQIHDKSETLRKLNEDRENTVYHRIVDPIQSFFNEIVFSDTESKEDFVNKLVSLVCNNKIKKNVTDKDLYNKFENDLRSTLKKFTKQNITKQDNIKKTDIKLDDQQSMNDQQFVEYLQAILDSLNNDEIPQMDKRANESSVTKLSKAVFNKLNTIPSSVIKNGAKILFTKYKDSSNDMEKNKDENNNSNKIQENNNAGNERNEELNKNTNEIKKDNKDNDSSDEEDIKL